MANWGSWLFYPCESLCIVDGLFLVSVVGGNSAFRLRVFADCARRREREGERERERARERDCD